MNDTTSTLSADARTGLPAASTAAPLPALRVLRNTYALLAMTLLFSAGVAAAAVAFALPAPGLVVSLVGMFGLLFAVHRLKNSGWALPAVFALTGFMGWTLGPALSKLLTLPGGAAISASVTNEGVEALGLQVGAQATAVFKAYSVMVATQP